MAKTVKDRRKLFRMHCPGCSAAQDTLSFECQKCGELLYQKEEDREQVTAIRTQVEEMEDLLRALETPSGTKGNPYLPLDRAFKLYKELRTWHAVPGMEDYLDRALMVLLPYKVGIMANTLRANFIVLAVLAAFPLLTLAVGWEFIGVGMLMLPALGWGLVVYKAWRDLRKARTDLERLEELNA